MGFNSAFKGLNSPDSLTHPVLSSTANSCYPIIFVF